MTPGAKLPTLPGFITQPKSMVQFDAGFEPSPWGRAWRRRIVSFVPTGYNPKELKGKCMVRPGRHGSPGHNSDDHNRNNTDVAGSRTA
ncbi:MAG: hypothetical protein J4O09_08835, partial [Chloroflexi bacterium]|nr:hypothetical protein [Chloroflexota bacterium]